VDDTLAVWPRGMGELQKFEELLNNMHKSIKFTMETEMKGSLTFLDIFATRQPDSPLQYSVKKINPYKSISTQSLTIIHHKIMQC
jgi:hypothetical protein